CICMDKLRDFTRPNSFSSCQQHPACVETSKLRWVNSHHAQRDVSAELQRTQSRGLLLRRGRSSAYHAPEPGSIGPSNTVCLVGADSVRPPRDRWQLARQWVRRRLWATT